MVQLALMLEYKRDLVILFAFVGVFYLLILSNGAIPKDLLKYKKKKNTLQYKVMLKLRKKNYN
jgi:hypothetical protein